MLGISRTRCGAASVVIILVTLYSWVVTEPGPNQLSHFDLAAALAWDSTTRIDPYAANTIDRSHYDGHWYTNKAPGTALLSAVVLAGISSIWQVTPFGRVDPGYLVHVLAIVSAAVPVAMATVVTYSLALDLGAARRTAIAASGALALGSPLTPAATTLFSHGLAATLGVSALALYVRSRHVRSDRALIACGVGSGLAAGYAVATEFTTGIILIGVALLWVYSDPIAAATSRGWRLPAPGLTLYGMGALVGVLPLAVYQHLSFGAFWRIGYLFTDFVAFSGMSSGFVGLTYPRPEHLATILFGASGLFVQAPIFLLALPAAIALYRRERGITVMLVAVIVGFILVNASFWEPLGGQSSGPRYLIPALPALGLLLAFSPWQAVLAASPTVLYSIVHFRAISIVEPKTGPGHANAFFDFWLPRYLAGDHGFAWLDHRLKIAGLIAEIPALLLVLALAAGAYAWPRIQGRPIALAIPAACFLTWLCFVAPVGPSGVPGRFVLADAASVTDRPLVVYGDSIELLSLTTAREVRKDGWIDARVRLRARSTPEANLTMFVHAVDYDRHPVGGVDRAPAGPGYPTNVWPSGQVLSVPVRVRVRDSHAQLLPRMVQLTIGMYGPGSAHLPAVDASGNSIESGPVVARLAERGGDAPPPSGDPVAEFTNGVVLRALDRSSTVRAGGTIAFTGLWQAIRAPDRDATLFVHLVREGRPIAQVDRQPRGGSYPTSLWHVGDVIRDQFELAVPGDTLAGTYGVIAGLYYPSDGGRIATTGGADHVDLGTVEISR